ncbi:MAG: ABC transporter ATP-binding protein, partial [Bradymonadaceae bacterium]
EPLGALDPMIRAGLQEELGEAFETLGTTVLLVTHDMDEAAFFGDRLTLMRQGSIVQTGTIDEIVRDPGDDFVRRFVRAQRSELSERLGDLGGGEGAA